MKATKDPALSPLLHDSSRIKSYIRCKEFDFIGPKANLKGSFISDSCKIFGILINSIVFPGLDIGEDTTVKNSILLPFVKIGSGAKIKNAVIDERIGLNPENTYPNVGNKCKISAEAGIGGACYVTSGKGELYLLKNKFLYNGESLK